MSGRNAHRTWAEVDLGRIAANARRVAQMHPNRALIGVVKADAYGHGSIPVARILVEAGVIMLGVGDSREAIELIRADIGVPVLILGAIVDGENAAVVANGMRSTIHSLDRIPLLEREAKRQGRHHHVHLKIDTGMGRLGMMPERAIEAARRVRNSPYLVLEGLCTHLANSRLDITASSNDQLERFRRVVADVQEAVGSIPVIHACNTAAAWNPEIRDQFTTAVRIGASLYGIPGAGDVDHGFLPAMSLKSQILFLKDVPVGTPVGYDAEFTTQRASRLAVLPVGYNDGLPSSVSRGGSVIVRGREAPVVGAVSMDYTTLDVTDIPGTCVGDPVLIFGTDGNREVPVSDLARSAGIGNYAITCAVGKRVQRIYHHGAETRRETECAP